MKKALLLLASAALLIVGCNKELVQSSPEGTETVEVSFSAALDNTERLTRAVADNDGNAAKVNHWVMEVRDAHDDLFIRQEKDADEGVLEQTFSFKLFKNQTYSIQFWADTKGAYVTEDLTAISTVGSVANVDSRDAFSANVEGYKSEKSEAKSIILYRPFGQLNIITTDLKDMKFQVVASTYGKFAPADLKVVASIPTTFNVQTQEAGPATEQTLTAATSYADFLAGAAKTTLFMDYIFASKDENDIVNFAFSFLSDGNEIAYDFTSIPMRRNYRTNIMGQLLSNDSQWTVTIAPAWDGEINPEYVVEGSVAAAIKAIKEGKTVIEISSPEDLDAPIALPAEADGKDISINVTGVSDKELTFLPAEGAQGPANLYITTDVNEQDLVINCPKTHVELNGGAYETVTATTSANTLVVGKDVSVKSLDIKAGNVEIHGKVDELKREKGIKAEMYASDRATLVNYINWAKAGDIAGLETDIDLAGENWTPLCQGNNRFIATFDGQGHTIKNMTIAVDWANGVGFFSDMSGVAKNFTIDNATIANTTADKGNMYGIVAGYAYGNATFENITVKNSKIHAFGKVGGILGMAADPNGTTVVKNCKVEDTEIIGCYNVANYVGLLQNAIVLEGCSSTNVEKKLGGRYSEDSYKTFDNVKVINKDTENPKYVLSSGKYWEYAPGLYYAAFADCYNDIHYGEWKALDGTVDALVFNTPDTPILHDLEPVATIGSTKYYDFYTALAALKTGETLEIWQAGEYTVQTLSTPASTTIDAKAEGVVFNHTAGYEKWIASGAEGRTVKNITWNVGTASFQYFHGVNLVNCRVNGLICTHSNNTYTDCEFYNADDYNLWDYATGSTFIRCKFTCPGGTKGGAINAYNGGYQGGLKTLVLENCEFEALEQSSKYAAIYIKPENEFDVQFTNCTANDKFFTGAISGSRLWNVKDNTNLKTKVTIDDKLVYANGVVMAISSAAQLKAFADYVNSAAGSVKGDFSLEADIDLDGVSWTPVGQTGQGQFGGTFDGKNHTISNLTINNTAETGNQATGFFGWLAYATVKDLNISTATVAGHHNVGVIAGYLEGSSIDGCTVSGAEVSCTHVNDDADGDKCGGIVGFAGNADTSVSNCIVSNTTINAGRDAGQVAGAAKTANIIDCTANNVTVLSNGGSTGANIRNELIGREL